MPLSEEEQRILSEIERRFYASDPKTAHQLSTTTLYRHAGRNCKWAAAGFVAGLAILLVSFASSLILGAIGFLIMLGSAFVFGPLGDSKVWGRAMSGALGPEGANYAVIFAFQVLQISGGSHG